MGIRIVIYTWTFATFEIFSVKNEFALRKETLVLRNLMEKKEQCLWIDDITIADIKSRIYRDNSEENDCNNDIAICKIPADK